MKIKILSVLVMSALAMTGQAHAKTNTPYFEQTSQNIYQKIQNKLNDIKSLAENSNNIIVGEDKQRYIEINNTRYRLNSDNYLLFDFPSSFTDESSFRNVFDFIPPEWELTWNDLGVVIVNTQFGNYDYGNGCLIEYMPAATQLDADTRVIIETASCAWNSNLLPSHSPASLSLLEATHDTATLTWDKVEKADLYKIYRDGMLVAQSSATKSLTFKDISLSSETRYSYQIEACNQYGCAEEKSATLAVETLPTPEVIPNTPPPPSLINNGTRTNIVNWNITSGATHYQVFRNGEIIADDLTDVSFVDTAATGVTQNTQYQYAVAACNDTGCSVPSQTADVHTSAMDKLAINVKNIDPNTNSVGVNIRSQYTSNQIFSENKSYSKKGIYDYGRGIYFSQNDGGKYWVQINRQPTNGQSCQSDSHNYKRTQGQNVVAVLDCLTPATLTSLVPQQITLHPTQTDFYLSMPLLHRVADGKEIITSSYIMTSSNEKVVTIGKNGKLIPQAEGESIITVQANPEYYDVATPITYTVRVNAHQQSVVLQNVEIGQSTLLSPRSEHQIIAPKAKTMVRAYLYAQDASDTTMPAVNITLSANGQTMTTAMTCPTEAKVGPFDAPSYDRAETCYSIIDEQTARTFIDNNMVMNISTDTGLSMTTMPKVNIHSTLNLKLVPGYNDRSQALAPDIDAFSDTIKQAYPLSTVNISVRESVETPSVLNQSLDIVEKIRKLETDGLSYFYGLVPGGCYGTVGLAFVGGTSAVGRDASCSPYLRSVFVHELGHNFGLNHAPGCGKTSSEAFWHSDAWEGVDLGKHSPSPLFDRTNNNVISPKDPSIHSDSDVMNYCIGDRFTQYNYSKLARHINAKSWFSNTTTNLLQTAEPTLMISGEIVDGKVWIDPVIMSDNAMYEDNGTSNSTFTILINSTDGAVMYPVHFNEIDHSDKKTFSLQIPASAHINAIKMFEGEHEVTIEIKGLKEQKTKAIDQSPRTNTVELSGSEVIWNHVKYPWLTVVHIKADGSRQALSINATGGSVDLSGYDLTLGTLSFSLSNGISSVMKTEQL